MDRKFPSILKRKGITSVIIYRMNIHTACLRSWSFGVLFGSGIMFTFARERIGLGIWQSVQSEKTHRILFILTYSVVLLNGVPEKYIT